LSSIRAVLVATGIRRTERSSESIPYIFDNAASILYGRRTNPSAPISFRDRVPRRSAPDRRIRSSQDDSGNQENDKAVCYHMLMTTALATPVVAVTFGALKSQADSGGR
jgi:hypothetical protein